VSPRIEPDRSNGYCPSVLDGNEAPDEATNATKQTSHVVKDNVIKEELMKYSYLSNFENF